MENLWAYKGIFSSILAALLVAGASMRAAAQPPVVVGIFGDLHGDQAIAHSVFEQMKTHGVTHIIGTGDFTGQDGPLLLEDILAEITPITGVAKEHVFLLPGNWDHCNEYECEDANAIIAKYGRLVFENYYEYGFVEINGERLMVSHFPQHVIPEAFMPPQLYRYGSFGQVSLLQTLEQAIFPPPDVALAIIAHTHVGGAFWDETSGKVVVNAGVLHGSTKDPTEPRAFAIYRPGHHTVTFYNADTKLEIGQVKISGQACESLLLKDPRPAKHL